MVPRLFRVRSFNCLPTQGFARTVYWRGSTGFPSANFLASHGLKRVILIQCGHVEPQTDLAHSLRRWQDAGFTLERKRIDSPDPIEAFVVPRPSWYRSMFQRMILMMGLRPSGTGGFGNWVPEKSAAG
jgi:hypothetical protein